MKQTNLQLMLIIVLLTLYGSSFGQLCDKRSDFQSSLEEFDWTDEYFNVQLLLSDQNPSGHNVTITSPFWINAGVSQPNTDHFSLSPVKDNAVEEGWEVIYTGLGEFDPDDPTRSEPVRYPQVILYNRYTSTLRIFKYLNQGQGSEAILTLQSIGDNGNALLSALSLPVKAIDKVHITKNYLSDAPNVFIHSGSLWTYQDIPNSL